MQIFVKNVDSNTLAINTYPDTYVFELKQEIENITGIQSKDQILIYGSKSLENDRILSDYNIVSESTISISLRLLSGGLVFVKYDGKIYELPIKQFDNKISSSSNSIINKLYNNGVFKKLGPDCKKKMYLTFNGSKLGKYTSLCNYGVFATSIPMKESIMKLRR